MSQRPTDERGVDAREVGNHLLVPEHGLGTDLFRLKMAVLVSSLSTVCLGYNTAVIAGAILYIKDDPDFKPLDSVMKGTLVSCALAGAAIGAVCGTLADRIGRRRSLLILACIFLLSPIAMALSPNIWFLIGARTIAGFGVGVSSVLVNLYISEIAPAQIRGQLGGWAPFLGTFGILVSYLVSAALGTLPGGAWRFQLAGAVVPALAQLLLQAYIPETPRWLLSKGRQEDATTSMRLLFPSASEDAVEAEIGKINTDLLKTSECKVGLCNLCDENLLPSMLGVSINVLQQVSGINVVIYFGPSILDDAGFSDTLSMIATAGVSVLQLVATALLIRHVDRIGRRPLALLGILLMLVGLGCLILSFMCEGHTSKGSGGMISWTAWVAIGGMFIFRGAFSLSLGPLPYIMTSEFFPQEARAAGTALSWMSNWGSNFLVSLSFPVVLDAFTHTVGNQAGNAIIFGIYMFFCLVAYAFIFALLPETRGVRLEDLERRTSLRRLSRSSSTGEERQQ